MKCQKCGCEFEPAAKCPSCGAPVAAAPGASSTVAPKPDRKMARSMTFGIAVVCVLAAVLIAALASSRNKTASPSAQVEEKIDVNALRAKAEQGNAQAQKDLGKVYAKGELIGQSYTEAGKWYRKAADQGNAAAQTALGELYEAGQGVPREDKEAAGLYRRAADQGYAPAQYNLAVLYVLGKGVPASNMEALKWYRQAADQGDELAQFNLGMRYYEGNGVQKDPIEAYKWLTLAAKRGVHDADKARTDLKTKMSSQDIAQAESRVSNFAVKQTTPPAR